MKNSSPSKTKCAPGVQSQQLDSRLEGLDLSFLGDSLSEKARDAGTSFWDWHDKIDGDDLDDGFEKTVWDKLGD